MKKLARFLLVAIFSAPPRPSHRAGFCGWIQCAFGQRGSALGRPRRGIFDKHGLKVEPICPGRNSDHPGFSWRAIST